MTREISDDHSRSPSSAEIDIARLKERYAALKDDVSDVRKVSSEIKALLIGHIANADSRHSQLLATFNQHNLEDAVVHQRVLQIDTHLTATDTRIASMQDESKRDPVTFWTAISAGAVAAGAVITAVFGGGKP